MNKEDILKASRNENQNKDIYELEIIGKGQRIGGLIAVCIAFILMLVERVILDLGTNYSYFSIIIAGAAGMWIYKAVKLKKKHEIMLAVLWTAVTIYAVIMYVLNLLG